MSKGKKIILFYGKTEEQRQWHWMPINMVFLAGMLIEAGYGVVIIDERVRPDYENYLVSLLPDTLLFGISSFSGYQIKSNLKAAKIVREHRSDLLIVWGGAHPSALPEQTLENEYVDFIVRGQGEAALVKIAQAIESGSGFDDIPGLAYRREGEVVSSPSETFDINTLPKLPFYLLDIEKYINPETQALNYTTSVGCSEYCTFCFWESAKSKKWQSFQIERVLDDLEYFVKKYNLKTVKFMDATFLASEARIIELCNGILERGLRFKWNCEGRVDEFNRISDQTLRLCEKTGANSIFLGIESLSPRMLKLLNKKIAPDDTIALVKRSRDFSFKLLFGLMFAMPGETLEDLKISAKFIKEAAEINPRIDYQRAIFSPYPSTVLYRLAVKSGYKPPQDLEGWHNFIEQAEIFYKRPPWFSESFFEEYKEELYKLFPDPGDYMRHLITS